MNARQKAKYYKKQLEALYTDYVRSANAAEKIFEWDAAEIQHMREQQATCMVEKYFDEPVEITDEIVEEMTTRLFDLYCNFKEAVQFEGHTDPETGKYILEAKLTVVMPDLETEE